MTDAQIGNVTSINQIDVAVVTDFNELAQALRSIVLELCSPSLTVRKFAQTTSGDYAAAPEWDMTVKPEVPSTTTVPPFTWILPDTAPSTEKTLPTNARASHSSSGSLARRSPIPRRP